MKGYCIRDKNGNFPDPKRVNKVYPTRRGAEIGYRAARSNWLQKKYLYDSDKDYGVYLHMWMTRNKGGSFLGQIYEAPSDEKLREYEQLEKEFNETFSIEEVKVSIEKVKVS